MQKLLSTFWNDEKGQDVAEYSLLLGFVALSGAAVLTGVRTQMTDIWQAISGGYSNAAGS